MNLADTGGRRRRRRASRVQQLALRAERPIELMADLVPGALVLRLLLTPDDFLRRVVAIEHRLVLFAGKRVELLEPHEGDIVELRCAPCAQQIEIDLAAREHDAPDFLRLSDRVRLVDDILEAAARQLVETGHRQLMPQQALRRHDDQRLAQAAQHLPTQHVEHLCRRRWHANLHVVFGAELQEALEAGRRMLGTLAFIAMRQEQRQVAEATPLGLARADELIDDHLRAIREVAELAFPDHESARLRGRVAVLEAHDGLFGQHGVDDAERRLALGDVLERHVPRTGFLMMQDRVAMEECAAAAVLAGNAHRVAILEQTRIGERLGAAPVERQFTRHHLAAVRHHLLHARMQRESGRHRRDLPTQLLQPIHFDA